MAAACGGEPPLLRVHWPSRLVVPSDSTGGVLLLGQMRDGNPQELVVAAAVAAAAGGGGGSTFEPVATLLQQPGDSIPSLARGPAFVMQPTQMPGGPLPLLLMQAAPADAAGPRTRRSAARQQQQQQPEQACDCQVILYDRRTPLPFSSSSSSSGGLGKASGCAPPFAAGRRRLAARLAPHLMGALLACLLLGHSQQLAGSVAAAYAALAGFATRQLAWLLTAQPAGVLLRVTAGVSEWGAPAGLLLSFSSPDVLQAGVFPSLPPAQPQASSCTASSASCWPSAGCSTWQQCRRRWRAGAPPLRAAPQVRMYVLLGGCRSRAPSCQVLHTVWFGWN